MSETSSRASYEQGHNATVSAQGPAGRAESERAARQRIILATGGILLALALAVALLRLQRLNELPFGLHHDEGTHGVDALRVLQGKHAVFFPANNGREGLIVYTIALVISFLGRTMLALRLPTALASAGTVFVVFWLGRLLFGRDESGRVTPWRGLLVGGIGAGLLAVSLGQTIIGRAALRANFLPLLLCLCLALLWWGWSTSRQQRSLVAHRAGRRVCRAAAVHLSFRHVLHPFLFLFFSLSFLLAAGAGVTKERMRAELPWAAIFIGRGRVGGCTDSHIFCSSPRTLFHSQQTRSGYSCGIRVRETRLGSFSEQCMGASAGFWLSWRSELRALQLRRSADVEPIGSVPFLVWCGDDRLALAKATRLSSVASLAGGAARAGDAGSRDVGLGPNTLRMIGAAPAVYLLDRQWASGRRTEFLRERWGLIRIFRVDGYQGGHRAGGCGRWGQF